MADINENRKKVSEIAQAFDLKSKRVKPQPNRLDISDPEGRTRKQIPSTHENFNPLYSRNVAQTKESMTTEPQSVKAETTEACVREEEQEGDYVKMADKIHLMKQVSAMPKQLQEIQMTDTNLHGDFVKDTEDEDYDKLPDEEYDCHKDSDYMYTEYEKPDGDKEQQERTERSLPNVSLPWPGRPLPPTPIESHVEEAHYSAKEGRSREPKVSSPAPPSTTPAQLPLSRIEPSNDQRCRSTGDDNRSPNYRIFGNQRQQAERLYEDVDVAAAKQRREKEEDTLIYGTMHALLDNEEELPVYEKEYMLDLQRALMARRKQGCFGLILMNEFGHGDDPYRLVAYSNGILVDKPIVKKGNKFKLTGGGNKLFRDIKSLVEYYGKNKVPETNCILKHPAKIKLAGNFISTIRIQKRVESPIYEPVNCPCTEFKEIKD